ncbi:MAG: hypothetical protein ACK54C_01885 [Betaproteobacteria bacterium]
MANPERIALLDAVNRLIALPQASEVYSDVLALLPAAKSLQARFSGDREFLNPLLELGVADREKFDAVVSLIEAKRADAGLPPLAAPPDERFDKTAYMRDFMQQKRERERRAVEIENMMRSERNQLRGRARLDFMQAQANKWKKGRDKALEAERKQLQHRLTLDEQKSVITAFWSTVDKELDGLEELARAERNRPVKIGKK